MEDIVEIVRINRLTPSIANEISTCTEKAYLHYALGRPEERSIGAVIGLMVHNTIEQALKNRIEGIANNLDVLVASAKNSVIKMVNEEEIDVNNLYMPYTEQMQQLEYLIRDYISSPEFESLSPQADFDGVEAACKVYIKPEDGHLLVEKKPLDDDFLLVSGRIDFLEYNPDQKELRIIDYKTGSRRFPWDLAKLRKRAQFRVYAWLLAHLFEVDHVAMIAHILNKSSGKTAKPTDIQILETIFSPRDLAACEKEIIDYYLIIQNGIHFCCDNCPPYCSYRDICGKQLAPPLENTPSPETEDNEDDDLWII
jgi:hypothetical protein